MKALTEVELQRFIVEHQGLIGARLQEVSLGEDQLLLRFWQDERPWYLLIELNAQAPLMLLFEQRPPLRKVLRKNPIGLFLKTYALNMQVVALRRREDLGRVVEMEWQHKDEVCRIEIRLFPHGQNFIVELAGRKLFWSKPQEMPVARSEEERARSLEMTGPSWQEVHTQWWLQKTQKSVAKAPKIEGTALAKKEKLLLQLHRELESRHVNEAQKAGEWLQGLGLMPKAVPEAWQEWIQLQRRYSENLSACFAASKLWQKKRQGVEERIARVQAEIEQLRHQPEVAKGSEESPHALSILPQQRRIQVGDYLVFLGKSAGDNMKLLKASRPFDLWFHLKDYPGSYGIIRRDRQQNVPPEILREVAKKVAEDSFGKKREMMKGERVDVVYAECRYVKPIKGDRLGRVHYQNARTLRVEID